LEPRNTPPEKLRDLLRIPGPDRVFAIGDAMRAGMSVDEIYALSFIDPWFLREMRKIVELERSVIPSRADGEGPASQMRRGSLASLGKTQPQRKGFTELQNAKLTNRS